MAVKMMKWTLIRVRKKALVRSYLHVRVPQAAGQVKILIFLVKINAGQVPILRYFEICVNHKIKHIIKSTRVIFYVRREVDLMNTAKVNAYIMDIFGKIELLSIHAT